MICRLCLDTLDEQKAVLLFDNSENDQNKTMPENYLVQLISSHLYIGLSSDDAISTCICTDCCEQLEAFHKFWKLIELKQTTLCSQFLEINCDVHLSEEGEVQLTVIKAEPETETAEEGAAVAACMDFIKDEPDVQEPIYLKADVKRTTASNKFPCMFCEKSFKMRRYLEEHVATHTGDRPIACSYCEMAFRCRSNMYTHVKTKHKAQWLKARADRESAKIHSNNNMPTNNNTTNDEKSCVNLDTNVLKQVAQPAAESKTWQNAPPPPLGTQPLHDTQPLQVTQPIQTTQTLQVTQPLPVQQQLQLPPAVPQLQLPPAAPQLQLPPVVQQLQPPPTAPQLQLTSVTQPMQLAPVVQQLSPILKAEPMEAINLTVDKTAASVAANKRVTRSSRRKTYSPKKVQLANCNISEDSNTGDGASPEKCIKMESLQTSKENEIVLANYDAVAMAAAATAAVAASLTNNSPANLQQRLCASIMQRQELLTAFANTASTTTTAATAAAVTAELASQCNLPPDLSIEIASTSRSYTCSICGQHLRNQRALNNHLHNKHNAQQPTPNLELAACGSCGELPGQKHRCLSKAKYACDVCGKSFKMKRYLEEHFATHTGVKLHTCTFCPTEFRSKSNMYHHTKRKHKLEWERSRATRNAAKSGVQEQPPQPEEPPVTTAATSTEDNAVTVL